MNVQFQLPNEYALTAQGKQNLSCAAESLCTQQENVPEDNQQQYNSIQNSCLGNQAHTESVKAQGTLCQEKVQHDSQQQPLSTMGALEYIWRQCKATEKPPSNQTMKDLQKRAAFAASLRLIEVGAKDEQALKQLIAPMSKDQVIEVAKERSLCGKCSNPMCQAQLQQYELSKKNQLNRKLQQQQISDDIKICSPACAKVYSQLLLKRQFANQSPIPANAASKPPPPSSSQAGDSAKVRSLEQLAALPSHPASSRKRSQNAAQAPKANDPDKGMNLLVGQVVERPAGAVEGMDVKEVVGVLNQIRDDGITQRYGDDDGRPVSPRTLRLVGLDKKASQRAQQKGQVNGKGDAQLRGVTVEGQVAEGGCEVVEITERLSEDEGACVEGGVGGESNSDVTSSSDAPRPVDLSRSSYDSVALSSRSSGDMEHGDGVRKVRFNVPWQESKRGGKGKGHGRGHGRDKGKGGKHGGKHGGKQQRKSERSSLDEGAEEQCVSMYDKGRKPSKGILKAKGSGPINQEAFERAAARQLVPRGAFSDYEDSETECAEPVEDMSTGSVGPAQQTMKVMTFEELKEYRKYMATLQNQQGKDKKKAGGAKKQANKAVKQRTVVLGDVTERVPSGAPAHKKEGATKNQFQCLTTDQGDGGDSEECECGVTCEVQLSKSQKKRQKKKAAAMRKAERGGEEHDNSVDNDSSVDQRDGCADNGSVDTGCGIVEEKQTKSGSARSTVQSRGLSDCCTEPTVVERVQSMGTVQEKSVERVGEVEQPKVGRVGGSTKSGTSLFKSRMQSMKHGGGGAGNAQPGGQQGSVLGSSKADKDQACVSPNVSERVGGATQAVTNMTGAGSATRGNESGQNKQPALTNTAGTVQERSGTVKKASSSSWFDPKRAFGAPPAKPKPKAEVKQTSVNCSQQSTNQLLNKSKTKGAAIALPQVQKDQEVNQKDQQASQQDQQASQKDQQASQKEAHGNESKVGGWFPGQASEPAGDEPTQCEHGSARSIPTTDSCCTPTHEGAIVSNNVTANGACHYTVISEIVDQENGYSKPDESKQQNHTSQLNQQSRDQAFTTPPNAKPRTIVPLPQQPTTQSCAPTRKHLVPPQPAPYLADSSDSSDYSSVQDELSSDESSHEGDQDGDAHSDDSDFEPSPLMFFQQPTFTPSKPIFTSIFMFLDKAISDDTFNFCKCTTEKDALRHAAPAIDEAVLCRQQVLTDRVVRAMPDAIRELCLSVDLATVQRLGGYLLRTLKYDGPAPAWGQQEMKVFVLCVLAALGRHLLPALGAQVNVENVVWQAQLYRNGVYRESFVHLVDLLVGCG